MKKENIYISLFALIMLMNMNYSDAKMTREAHLLYQQACSFEYKNDYETAIKIMQQAIEMNGDDTMLYTKIAGLYADVERYEDALSAYKKAVKLRPNDAFIYISMGNILQTIGDYENAYNAFNEAQAIYPEYKYNYLNLANVEYFRKNYKEAIEFYNLFLSTYPEHKEALENLANVYYLAHQPEKSCETYSILYKKYPAAFNDFEKYGIALFDTKQFTAAAEMLEKALVQDNANEMILAKLAITYQNLNENEKALEYFKMTFDVNPNLAELKFDYANLLGNMNKNDEAIEAYKDYIKAFPDVPEAYKNLGLVYKRMNNLDLALFNLEKSYSMDSTNLQTKKELAICYHAKQDYVNAVKYYDLALKGEPNNSDLLANKALVLHAMKNYIPAIEIYKTLLSKQSNERLESNLIAALIAYGYELYDKQDYGQSILYFEDAINLDDKSASAYYGYAKANEKMGCSDIALENYKKAVELEPANQNYIKSYEKYRMSCIKTLNQKTEPEINAQTNTSSNTKTEEAVKITNPVTASAQAYILNGDAAFSKQLYDDALDNYTKAIVYSPADEYTMLKIANIYKLKNNNIKAVDFYNRVLVINPQNVDAYFNKGLAQAKQKNYSACIKSFEKVIELSPEYPYAYYSLGMAYEQTGNITKAIEYYYLYTGIETNEKMLNIVNQKIKQLENEK